MKGKALRQVQLGFSLGESCPAFFAMLRRSSAFDFIEESEMEAN